MQDLQSRNVVWDHEGVLEHGLNDGRSAQWLMTRPVEARVCIEVPYLIDRLTFVPPTNQNLVLFLGFIIL